jgi:hypothetical protein
VQVSGPSQTDILVAAGDYIWVMAQGEIRLGMFAGFADPGGRSSAFLAGYSTVPELPHGALLCRVTGETWQICGAEREFQAAVSGQLEFTVNDDDRANNSGAFDVRIFVSPYSHRTQYLAAQPTGPPSRSATDNPLTSTGNPEQYLAGYVSCWDSFAWVASGDLTNTASRPIEVAITLSISGGGLLGYGSETKAYVIQPGAIESIYFAGPEVSSDSSCSVLINAQWAD